MYAFLGSYLGVFSNTSKMQIQRAFPSHRQPKEASQGELKMCLNLPPRSAVNGQPDLHFKYISATKAFALLQPAVKGSLAAFQLHNPVQLF